MVLRTRCVGAATPHDPAPPAASNRPRGTAAAIAARVGDAVRAGIDPTRQQQVGEAGGGAVRVAHEPVRLAGRGGEEVDHEGLVGVGVAAPGRTPDDVHDEALVGVRPPSGGKAGRAERGGEHPGRLVAVVAERNAIPRPSSRSSTPGGTGGSIGAVVVVVSGSGMEVVVGGGAAVVVGSSSGTDGSSPPLVEPSPDPCLVGVPGIVVVVGSTIVVAVVVGPSAPASVVTTTDVVPPPVVVDGAVVVPMPATVRSSSSVSPDRVSPSPAPIRRTTTTAVAAPVTRRTVLAWRRLRRTTSSVSGAQSVSVSRERATGPAQGVVEGISAVVHGTSLSGGWSGGAMRWARVRRARFRWLLTAPSLHPRISATREGGRSST